MITTRDVLRQNDEIHTIWELGMRENAMSRDQIIKANIQEIAKRIISRNEGFVFRLSGVLLFGIARLYSKKSMFFLIDCESALSRISLNFHREEKKKNKEKQNPEHETIEIDEETIKLWTKEGNIDNIIAKEKKQGTNENLSSNLVLNTNKEEEPKNEGPITIVDDDFGNVPFDVPNDFEMNPIDNEPEFQFNEQIEVNPEERIDNHQVGLEIDNLQDENAKKQKKRFIIDSIPIIPLTQLSMILEDTSKLVCNRPITKGIVGTDTKSYDDSKDFEFLLNEVKKAIEKDPFFQKEDLNNDGFEPPEISDNEQQVIQENANHNEIAEDQIEQQIYSVNLITDMKSALAKDKQVELLQIVRNHSRKELALSFFTSLSLKNKGIVEIHQSSNESISLSKGPNFSSLF